ncbi:MAG TPA: LamG domain-containing protein, partial [Humisphaera sp.]
MSISPQPARVPAFVASVRARKAGRTAVAAAAAAATLLGSLPAQAAITHRYSFTSGGSDGFTVIDSVGTANGVLVDRSPNGAQAPSISGGQVQLNNLGTSNDVAFGNYVDLPNNIAKTQNVTIEGWATWGGGSVWQRIFDIGTNNQGEQAPASTVTGYNGTSYVFASPKVDRSNQGFGSELRVDPNSTNADHNGVDFGTGEHHFAVVIQGGANGTMKLYKDGAEVASSATTLNPANIDQVNTWIGRSNWQGDPFYNGSVNEFRIYDTAQSAAQLAASFGAGPDALPSAALTRQWGVTPGPADYNTPGNWSPSGLPAAGDTALFANGGEAVV